MSLPRLSRLVVHQGFAFGWAAGAGIPIAVRLLVDGKPVATEWTGQSLPSTVRSRIGAPPAGAAGFAFALPAEVLDGFVHELTAVLPDPAGDHVYGETLSWASASVRGEVRQQGRLYVGSVWFDSHDESPPALEIHDASGVRLAEVPLASAAQREAHGHAAQFMVPCADLPEGLLHFSCAGQRLRGSPCSRQQVILGVLEDASATGVRGWAFDGADLGRPLELTLRVDGKDVAWFRPNLMRSDIAEQLGQKMEEIGLVGFHHPLPESVQDGAEHLVEVVSAATGHALRNGARSLRAPRPWRDWAELATVANSVAPLADAGMSHPAPRVSLVILNRNGAPVLAEMLASWARHNRTVPAELIVVDHASSDDSLDLLRRWEKVLDLHIIPLDHNGSFSDSSNLGARAARGEFLLFMNNDIVWLHDALPRLLESFDDPQVGLVGLKLLKVVGESVGGRQFASEVQHLGVRFKLRDQGYWPFEAGVHAPGDEAEYAPQHVPVVTGAVLLCRRSDFEQAGGFHSEYFYGFEDVEFCLRLAQSLRKTVICRNDCVALHHHGHTRLSGRAMSIYDRVVRNAAVLERHVGVWVKQAYWRSLVQGDGYITREALTVGVVLDGAARRDAGPGSLAAAALEFGAWLRDAMPHARTVLLEPAGGWKQVAGLHVLLVGDRRYDIRSLKDARSDLLVLAWVRDDAAGWAALPWWGDFDGAVVPQAQAARAARSLDCAVHASGPAAPLGDALGLLHWRLRVAIRADASRAAQARDLRAALRADGLPCWIVEEPRAAGAIPRMADVCVTLADSPQSLARDALREDVLNVVWLASGARAPRNRPAAAVFTQHAPTAAWLQEQMEIRVGDTFRAP